MGLSSSIGNVFDIVTEKKIFKYVKIPLFIYTNFTVEGVYNFHFLYKGLELRTTGNALKVAKHVMSSLSEINCFPLKHTPEPVAHSFEARLLYSYSELECIIKLVPSNVLLGLVHSGT